MNANRDRLGPPSPAPYGSTRIGDARPNFSRAAPLNDAALLTRRHVDPDQPASELIRAALELALARMRAAEPEVLRGNVEGVHRLRTSTRRLRSELQALRPLVDHAWRRRMEDELKWLATQLGDVRDLDVLDDRLRATERGLIEGSQSGQEPSRQAATTLEPFFSSLHDRRHHNLAHLSEALRSDRYRELMTLLEASIERPRLRSRAARPCRKVLPPLAVDAWKKLKRKARGLRRSDPDTRFHKVRKLVKRARYTAELVAPAVGHGHDKQAERFLRLVTELQDVLGELQDATVAREALQRFLVNHSSQPELSCATKQLICHQEQAAANARKAFLRVWSRLDRKKSLRWLKPAGEADD